MVIFDKNSEQKAFFVRLNRPNLIFKVRMKF
jgi:hypothetical protein